MPNPGGDVAYLWLQLYTMWGKDVEKINRWNDYNKSAKNSKIVGTLESIDSQIKRY